MIVGTFDLQMGEVDGYHLCAPTSYWQASQEEIEEHTGGCGPGKLGDWFIPDTMLGESVHLACEIHDWCYHAGQTLQDKFTADLLFLVNMVILVNDGDMLDAVRLRRVMTYYECVAFGGEEAFKKGKENG